jgi:2-dehydropantoate 2-reductase
LRGARLSVPHHKAGDTGMRIVVMGSGGVGGYFGARLAASGEDVRFVARGAHLAAMQRDGLKITSKLGDLTVKPVTASPDPAALGPADLVVIAVKLGDTDSAIAGITPLMGADTSVVSFQNGVGAIDALTKAFGPERVLGGVAQIAAEISSPGSIRHTGTLARLVVGEPKGGLSPRVEAIAAAAKKAGIDVIASDDITRAIWEKFVFLASFSGVTTLARRAKGAIFADPDLKQLYADALSEAVAVARARGAALAPDHAERALKFTDGLPAEMKSSMFGDLERGNRLEVEYLSGAVARLGAAAGVKAPVHQAIYAALKPYMGGRPAA